MRALFKIPGSLLPELLSGTQIASQCRKRKMHVQLLSPVSELLLLLLLLGYEPVTSSPFRRDFLQSQNWAPPNPCHSLLQEPTYAALTAPASSGNCREPGMGTESSHCSAIKRNHDHRTDPLTTHISKNPATQILTSFLQSTGLTLDSVFYLFCYGVRIDNQPPA